MFHWLWWIGKIIRDLMVLFKMVENIYFLTYNYKLHLQECWKVWPISPNTFRVACNIPTLKCQLLEYVYYSDWHIQLTFYYSSSNHALFTETLLLLTLNVPFHSLEPHLSRTSRALPTRVPRTRAAVRRRPRNSHSHASRGSAHFHAFAGRSSAHFHAIGSRSSAHFHAIRSRRSANFDGSISHAFPRIPAQW